jgi:hypothetical protein
MPTVEKDWPAVGSGSGRRRHMYVSVHHHVSDPEGFRAAEQRALEEGLPEGFSLPIHATTPDYTTVICIWEGESVEAVRDLVESVVGEYSENEYFETKVDGLPAS